MNLVVYSKPNCVYCTKLKNLLQEKSIQYQELVLGEDFSRDFILSLFPTARTYPIVSVDGRYIGGFSEVDRLLKENKSISQSLILG